MARSGELQRTRNPEQPKVSLSNLSRWASGRVLGALFLLLRPWQPLPEMTNKYYFKVKYLPYRVVNVAIKLLNSGPRFL